MYAYDLFAKFAFYYEKTTFIMIASVAGAALNIGLNYIFIKMFGYIAAGYTTLVCFVVYAGCHYLFMKKVCNQCCNGEYPYEEKKLLLITVPFVIVGFLLLLTYNYPIVRYALVVLGLIMICIFRKKIITTISSIIKLKRNNVNFHDN